MHMISKQVFELLSDEGARRLNSEFQEDVRQEACVALLIREQHELIREPRRWYRKASRFIRYSLRRAENRTTKHYQQFPNCDLPDAKAPEPELTRILATELSQLPDRARKAIELRFFESLSLKEAAAEMGMHLRAYQTLLSRSLRRLRTPRLQQFHI